MADEKDRQQISLFRGKEIRKTIHQKEWWFVVSDIIVVLTDSVNPTDYIKKMKLRDEEIAKGWGQFVTPLPINTSVGKNKGKRCGSWPTVPILGTVKMIAEE